MFLKNLLLQIQSSSQAKLPPLRVKQWQTSYSHRIVPVTFFIVAADTIVCLDHVIYGKPKDRSDAKKILEKLSNRTHSVFTAVSLRLIENGEISTYSFIEESKVSFNTISRELMERYLDTGDSLDKAGAYGIQGPSLTFISKVDGDYANVVGFPLSRFVKEMDKIFKSKFGSEVSWFDYF